MDSGVGTTPTGSRAAPEVPQGGGFADAVAFMAPPTAANRLQLTSHDCLRLLASIAIDLVGVGSFAVPLAGEVTDVAWAPIAALLIYLLHGRVAWACVGLAEELLPGLDFVPTATLAWWASVNEARASAVPMASPAAPHGGFAVDEEGVPLGLPVQTAGPPGGRAKAGAMPMGSVVAPSRPHHGTVLAYQPLGDHPGARSRCCGCWCCPSPCCNTRVLLGFIVLMTCWTLLDRLIESERRYHASSGTPGLVCIGLCFG